MGVVNVPNMATADQTSVAALADGTTVSGGKVETLSLGGSGYDLTRIRLHGDYAGVTEVGPFTIYSSTPTFDGAAHDQSPPIKDPIFGIAFNMDGAIAGYPGYGTQREMKFYDQAPPNGALEDHSNYRSIDGTVSYRPWMFAIDLNTHESETVYQGHRKFQIIDYTGSKSITYTSSIDTLALTGTLSCQKMSTAELSSPNGFVIMTQAVTSGVIDLLTMRASKSDALGTGNALTWYGSLHDGNALYTAGSIYSTFDGATWDTARTTIRSRDAAGNPLETLNVLNGRIAITGLWGGTTLKPAGLRVEGTIPGIAWRDTVETGSHRNFAILNSWASAGYLDFVVSAAAGGNPGSVLLRFDGPNYTVVMPQLSGTGTRHVVVNADGVLSAP